MNQLCELDQAVMEAPAGTFSAAPQLRVETIPDYPSFLDLEPVWNDLVEAAGIDHPYRISLLRVLQGQAVYAQAWL
jgi:hypothetical protein